MFELGYIGPGLDELTDDALAAGMREWSARLADLADRLRAEGCSVRATLPGLAFDHPEWDFDDLEDRLAGLGIREGEVEYTPARTTTEVMDALNECYERVRYDRSLGLLEDVADGRRVDPAVLRDVLADMERVEDDYGRDNLEVDCEFCRGMVNGKLSALRWVLGFDWDDLET